MERGENPKPNANFPVSSIVAESVHYEGIGEIRRGDLQCENSIGLIIHAPFGTLIHLREDLERLLGRRAFIFGTISAKPLYVVHWEDLSEEKRRQIGEKRV